MTKILISILAIIWLFNQQMLKYKKRIKKISIKNKNDLVENIIKLKEDMCEQRLIFIEKDEKLFLLKKEQAGKSIQVIYIDEKKSGNSKNIGFDVENIADYLNEKHPYIFNCSAYFEKTSTILIE